LRPSGAQGLLVTSYRTFEEYHHERAAPWERVALLRGRVACVLPAENERPRPDFAARLEAMSYEPGLAEATLRSELVRMRKLIEHERAGDSPSHLRFSPGGLTDLEFMAAYGQLRHGDSDSALRTTSPFAALERMVQRGDIAAVLLDHYRFLARACLRLRLLRDYADDRLAQTDDLPLARSLGLSRAQLQNELASRMAVVRETFVRVLG
jgi:glutamate-ammonia-ligase adenylyltransferase